MNEATAHHIANSVIKDLIREGLKNVSDFTLKGALAKEIRLTREDEAQVLAILQDYKTDSDVGVYLNKPVNPDYAYTLHLDHEG